MNESSIASVIFGKVHRAILAILFTHCDQEFYLRQIVRAAGVGQGAVQRELANLHKAGLIVRRVRGRQVFYQANEDSPVFSELRGLIVKTVGIADVLKASIADIADRIKVAFIYGSFAKGAEKAASDIDVILIGDVDFSEAVKHLSETQNRLGREVNPAVFSVDEFVKRVSEEEHFITSVLLEPKIFLIGDESELARLA